MNWLIKLDSGEVIENHKCTDRIFYGYTARTHCQIIVADKPVLCDNSWAICPRKVNKTEEEGK